LFDWVILGRAAVEQEAVDAAPAAPAGAVLLGAAGGLGGAAVVALVVVDADLAIAAPVLGDGVQGAHQDVVPSVGDACEKKNVKKINP